MSYKVIETPERVPGMAPDLLTRFRSRAERRARRRNAGRLAFNHYDWDEDSWVFSRSVFSYRYEVVREGDRWAVVVMQNRLEAE